MQKNDPDITQFSILSWIFKNNIVSEKSEPLDFKDHAFLLDILTDWSPRIVVKACAQVGKSVTFNLKALFACQKFKWNIIYTMPTDDDVKEFVGTKTNKILQANPHIFSGIQTDNIERKEIDNRFIYFKGTISKSAAISTSADLLIHDEASRSDQQQLGTYKSRTKDSSYKGRWLFSNPTTERDELDQEWIKSDQKEWMVTCPHCKLEQQITFPENLDLDKKCFICSECKKEWDDDVRRKGHWVAQVPERTYDAINNPDGVNGYHLSHLIATKITAKEIIEDSEGDQEYFHNFVLGEPYNPGDLKVSKSTILDLWTPNDLKTDKFFLGVDVGNIKHYVLGSEKGVFEVGKFSDWQVLDDMMKMYKPKLVIDAMPDNTMAKYYTEKYQGALMSFFQDNMNNPQTIVWWGEKTLKQDKSNIVYSSRDRIIDQLIDTLLNAKLLYGLKSDKDFNDYIKHWETLRRVKVVSNKGIERYVWESTTGVDHYVFATLYYYLSLLSGGSGVFFKEPSEDDRTDFIGGDNVVGDFGEMLSQANEWE